MLIGDRCKADELLDHAIGLHDALPDEAILDVLSALEQEHATPSEQTMLLLGRFADLARHDSRCAARISFLGEKWLDTVEASGGDTSKSLHELLRARQNQQFTPDDYLNRMIELSRSRNLQPASPVCDSLADANASFDPATLGVHAVRVGIALLEELGRTTHRDARHDHNDTAASVIGHIEQRTQTVLDAGHPELIATVATVSREIPGTDEIRSAIRALNSARHSRRAIESAIKLVLHFGRCSDEIAEMIKHATYDAVPLLIDTLADAEDGAPDGYIALCPAITERLTTAGSEVSQYFVELAASGAKALNRPLATIPRLPLATAVMALEPLRRHTDPAIRFAAYQAMTRLPGHWSDHLIDAVLDDKDNRVRMTGIHQLERRPAQDGDIDLLTKVLMMSLDDRRSPPPGQLHAAALALTESGEPGVRRACKLIKLAQGGVNKAHGRVGAALAQALEPHRQDQLVARALRRWWYSPTHLFRWLRSTGPNKQDAA
jgi:hypothetical protein